MLVMHDENNVGRDTSHANRKKKRKSQPKVFGIVWRARVISSIIKLFSCVVWHPQATHTHTYTPIFHYLSRFISSSFNPFPHHPSSFDSLSVALSSLTKCVHFRCFRLIQVISICTLICASKPW